MDSKKLFVLLSCVIRKLYEMKVKWQLKVICVFA